MYVCISLLFFLYIHICYMPKINLRSSKLHLIPIDGMARRYGPGDGIPWHVDDLVFGLLTAMDGPNKDAKVCESMDRLT